MGRKGVTAFQKYLQPSYYFRRPKRLGFLCLLGVLIMCVVVDHKNQGLQIKILKKQLQSLNSEKKIITEKLKSIQIKSSELLEGVKENAHHKELKRGLGDVSLEDWGKDDDTNDGVKPKTVVESTTVVVKDTLKQETLIRGAGAWQNTENIESTKRQEAVKAAMDHAWKAYKTYAWGFDELQPQTKGGVNNFGGLGATIVDSLDTLIIMGFKEEFQEALRWIKADLNFNKGYVASTFETTIRLLGGLLSAYDLSGEKLLLEKATDLAERLIRAFETPTGIPFNRIDLVSGSGYNEGWTGGGSTLAEFGTEQLELIGLSQRTGISKFAEVAEKVIQQVKRTAFPPDGLVSLFISPQTGRPLSNKVSFGAMGDSFYEYLLKVWIQGGKTPVVQMYREMWEQSMSGMISGLIQRSTPSNFTYVAERAGTLVHKMDELACFTPGMLALGHMSKPDHPRASEYLQLAKELGKTCYNFYASTESKLAGEHYYFQPGRDMVLGQQYNIQRPETVESLFYLWRATHDPVYREWGWNIFQAFEKQCKVEAGYTGLQGVSKDPAIKDNMMQSFFLAETLKYLYLLFSPDNVIPLDEWVFNTEAHPLRILPRDVPGFSGHGRRLMAGNRESDSSEEQGKGQRQWGR